MIASFVITFREVLEAALVVGIVLGYLARIGQRRYNRWVYLGLLAAIAASLVGAWLFNALAGGFTGRAEQIFEGVTMLTGALLLTTMILWMMHQQHIAGELQDKVAAQVTEANKLGLLSLVFIAVLREGVETVIFLGAASLASSETSLPGALAGIAAAAILGYGIFASAMKVNLKTFFGVTSVVLILFAAGLVGAGVHELQEANIVPVIVARVWNLNPPLNADGSFPLLHEEGYVGSILHALFGYNASPSLPEVLSYLAYLAGVGVLWRKARRAFQHG